MELKKIISEYRPVNQQEEQDKGQILAYLALFPDLLSRENSVAHFTSSAFIVNKERTKTLFIRHKIYNTWCWTGGHVDGNANFIEVAQKEAQEETGLRDLTLLAMEIASLDILAVPGHFKDGKWVSAHQHLSVAYVFEADEKASLRQNKLETTGVAWIPLEAMAQRSGEPGMVAIYRKLLSFIKQQVED